MTIEMLVIQFIRSKHTEPLNADELLDFAQRSYVLGELSFPQYHQVIRELNSQGAKKPEYFLEH